MGDTDSVSYGPCQYTHTWTSSLEPVLEGAYCDCGTMRWHYEVCPYCKQKITKHLPATTYDLLYGRDRPDWHY